MDRELLSSTLAQLAEEHQVPSAHLAVHHQGHTVTLHAGVAATSPPPAVPLGSLTKPFTATLAMILVADGDVDLDLPLATYLPELAGAGRMTLRQVLSHQAGLASDVTGEQDHTGALSDWVAEQCRPARLVHRPGEVFSYSNVGYVVVGRLVTAVTGLDWAEAVESILLAPLGIVPAFVLGRRGRAARPVAPGHTVHTTLGRPVPTSEEAAHPVEAPNGGLALDAADLVTFARVHLADPALPRPLDGDLLVEMRRDQVAGAAVGPFGLADGWGLGWAGYRDTGQEWHGHDGMTDGTSCHLRFEPASGTVVALTTNANTGAALWRDLVTHLRGQGIPVGDHRFAALPEDLRPVPAPAEYAGTYRNGDQTFEVAPGPDGDLVLSMGSTPHSTLSCFEGRHFVMRNLASGQVRCVGRFLPDPATGGTDFLQFAARLSRRRLAHR